MATSAVIAHRIPGRVRLVVHSKRGDADYFSGLSQRLERFPKVQSARTNPVTGSVALNFIGDLTDILEQAQEEDLLTIMDDVKSAGKTQERPVGAPLNLVGGRDFNRFFVMGAVLAAIGVFQVFRGDLFPPALAVFWFANDAFRLAEKSH